MWSPAAMRQVDVRQTETVVQFALGAAPEMCGCICTESDGCANLSQTVLLCVPGQAASAKCVDVFKWMYCRE